MRGLQSMLRDQIVSPSFSNGTKKTRIEAFVESILPSLSLLMKSKYQALKSALVDLANSTVSLWNSAQTEDLEIAVSLDLHVSLHNNWNSPAFDPDDGTAQESKTSSNDPHIYTLFLSINTKGLTLVQVEQEIFIHHGIGMAETSALVLRGKEEQEQKEKTMNSPG
ncbi:transcriptional regulator, LysR family protein [Marssonina coronariae]|uniref:Transcriptional regulator, LysR family protein n=1 Tax=Diplocarpon coronariae TaxID=2795749 RepID=A0A218ZDY6_9HELO|nr:transcriptional regulator, LysR family protein [Marssonina coronariae]